MASLKPNVDFTLHAGMLERLATLQASHLDAALPPLNMRNLPAVLKQGSFCSAEV